MNENIDLTKILKDCPSGWKFYSTLFGDGTIITNKVSEGNPRPITICDSVSLYATCKITRNGHPFAEERGECCLFPSREMRDWSKFEAPWYKKDKKEKFDPKTLKTFDKVLVRDNYSHNWTADFYSYKSDNTAYPYRCISEAYAYCIPYKDDTKHLVGTTDEAPEYYKYWED